MGKIMNTPKTSENEKSAKSASPSYRGHVFLAERAVNMKMGAILLICQIKNIALKLD